jgi:crossover junction endodeoxyribonuclease RusA
VITVELPWPPSALRPNAASPGNWRKKQVAAKLYKSVCLIEIKEQGLSAYLGGSDKLHMTLRFCPPDRRRRDMDNLLAQMKQAIDAVSETIGVDDCYFNFTLMRGEPVKGGSVSVTITEE